MEQKENHTPQMETQSEAEQIAEVQAQLLSLSEIFGKTPYRLFGQYHRCRVGIQELSRIFGVLQSEEEAEARRKYSGRMFFYVIGENILKEVK